MDKVVFLHGFFASGSCVPAVALREALQGRADVLTPDLPLRPLMALDFLRELCARERPVLLVGNSNGSFLAQIMACELGLPALLGNPHLEMTCFLRSRIGTHRYKSPRQDGREELTIDESLIAEFATLEARQWDRCSPRLRSLVWGLFGDHDPIARYESLFLQHYERSFHFPGAHTPTADEVRQWYAPLALRLLDERARAITRA